MGLSQKKARTKPPPQLDATTKQSSTASLSLKDKDPKPDALDKVKDLEAPIKQVKTKGSWSGTWPRKSIASTLVARETILADKPTNGSSSDLSRFEVKKDLTLSNTEQSKGNGVEEGITERPDVAAQAIQAKHESISKATFMSPPSGDPDISLNTLPREPEHPDPPRPVAASGWFGWLGAPVGELGSGKPSETNITKAEVLAKTLEEAPATSTEAIEQAEAEQEPRDSAVAPQTPNGKSNQASDPHTSWFGSWATVPFSTAGGMPKVSRGHIESSASRDSKTVELQKSSGDSVTSNATPLKSESAPMSGSSWVFWSTDTSKKDSDSANSKEAGQIAIAGEDSQHKPEPAKAMLKGEKKGKSAKRGRPVSTEEQLARGGMPSDRPSSRSTTSASPAAMKNMPNSLLPDVRTTYGLVENPSILQHIARLLRIGHQPSIKHVFLAKEQPKLKKALAIGIHGLFPAPLLRTVIGQPTGTSIRFANYASAAIRRWTDAHGSVGCHIEKVALEGEGKISERVDNLWKLLLNWMDHIRSADFIMIACHSQGVPVAVMLVAKLIEFGVVTSARVGVCAMAGVSLGPFADYKSRLFGGTAAELFEFANPESPVSLRYANALRIALKYGVRVTYCGSIDDQVISLESAIFATASHPYIYRAVFVDGRIHAPDFIAHLVGFALKLRNLGVSDHGLIRELSAPLAGSLYTGEGHSRLYDDEKVYDVAMQYTLETTSIGDVPLEIKPYEVPTNANPYVLPWIMRGLLEEHFVKTELHAETTQLLKQFDEWKPATKVLKDVKYRLEAVRSKLE